MSDNNSRVEPKPLSSFRRGDRVRVVAIEGGRGVTHRLLAMGLIPGVELYVLESDRGPMTLCVQNSRVAIGRGIASRILVATVAEDYCKDCPREAPCPEPRRG